MGKSAYESLHSIYKTQSSTVGCLEIRLFYVRISPCDVNSLPKHLTLYYLRREPGIYLEINGNHIPSSDAVPVLLRRDRFDKDSSDVTYIGTDTVKFFGALDFEVYEEGNNMDLILCGSFQRVDAAASWSDSKSGWSVDCYSSNTIAANGRSAFFRPKLSPSIEVYVAGCCSNMPVVLTETILVTPRRKPLKKRMLDVIPENEEVVREQSSISQSLDSRQQNLQLMEEVMEKYYTEDMYCGEDIQVSWFNAGVRVGVGIGLGMCLGVGLLMQSYRAATWSFRRRFF